MAWSVSAQRYRRKLVNFPRSVTRPVANYLTGFSAYTDDLIPKWHHHELRFEESRASRTTNWH